MTVTSLPALAGWSDYESALTKRDDLTAALRQAYLDVERLKREAPAARQADDEAAAQAVLDGAKAPARRSEQKHADDLKEAEARVRVTETALRRQDGICLALLRDNPERAQQAALAETAAAGATYLTLLDGLAQARAAFHAARITEGWLENPGRKYKPAGSPRLDIPGTTTLNGEALAVEPVLSAMAAEVEGSAEWTDGPWRNSPRILKSEAIRLVHRVRAIFNDHGHLIETAHYHIPATETDRDEADRQAERAAQDRRQQERTLRAMEQENPGSTTPAPAAAAAGTDPLADLR